MKHRKAPYHDKGKVIVRMDCCKLKAVPPIPSILQILTDLIKGQKEIEQKKLDDYNTAQRKSARMKTTLHKKRLERLS
tara:strand:- start:467 stop:700 length:234 start_codon:yes stop_codon:yes gene_type:complete